MEFHCLVWIPHLWNHLCSTFILEKEQISPLPDDVLVEILSRLPVEEVQKCRSVCKNWHALTSTHHFSETHLRLSPSNILVQHREWWGAWTKHLLDLFILDDNTRKTGMASRVYNKSIPILQQGHPVLKTSCNGLVLFGSVLSPSIFIICNPMIQECVTLKTPAMGGFICGFFFHLPTKEYRLLYVHWTGNCCSFIVGSLRSMCWRRLRAFPYMPRRSSVALALNQYLYWINSNDEQNIPPCTKSIIVFNINTEEFCAMPHPGHECRTPFWHDKMNLLEMEGKLSACLLFAKVFYVWVLEDSKNWGWVKKYRIDLSWGLKQYSFAFGSQATDHNDIRLVKYENNELLLFWPNRGLFLYNLQVNTVMKVKLPGLELFRVSSRELFFTRYTQSLVSVRALRAG